MVRYFVFNEHDIIKMDFGNKPGIFVLVDKQWVPYTNSPTLTSIVVEFNAARNGYSDVYSVNDVEEISEEELKKYL